MAGRQRDAATAPTRPADSLRAVELSDEFVKLLGVDRGAAESLQLVFAARCRQLLPARRGAPADPSRRGNEEVATRVAPRAVLLTSDGSLFVVKSRVVKGCLMMERLEFGARLQPSGGQSRKGGKRAFPHHPSHGDEDDDEAFHFFGGGSAPQGRPLVRIDVMVDERALEDMQSICITGWAHTTGKWAPREAGVSFPAIGQTAETHTAGCSAAAALGGGATALSHPYSPARGREAGAGAGGNGGATMKVRFVLALQFYARSGLLAGVLALKIKQVAAQFGHLGIMTFTTNRFCQSLHHARQSMALWAAASAPPSSSPPSSPSPQGGRSLAHVLRLRRRIRVRGVKEWARRLMSPRRPTLRDVVCNGVEMLPTMTVYDGDGGGHENDSFSSLSSSQATSLSSSQDAAMYTTDEEAEREAGRAEREDCCFSTDNTLLDDDTFNSRLVGVLDDITRVEGLLVAQRVSEQQTLL